MTSRTLHRAEGMTGMSWNGAQLANDEFAFIVGNLSVNPRADKGVPYQINLPCMGSAKRRCILPIRFGLPDADKQIFGWDGNYSAPSLTPSIGCDQRCGWHGHLTNGVLVGVKPA